MAKRKKSIRDIERQRDRMLRRLRVGDPRARRVVEISDRYANNIQRSKQWKEAFKKGQDEYWSYDFMRTGNDAAAKTAGYGMADSEKVSRSTYMGLANG